MIRLAGVSLTVGAFALRDINLEIDKGEYFAILGPTGSGKTMLLETLAGLRRPSSGEIWIAGEDVTGVPPERRHLGFMYQDYLLFPHLTVRSNITFGLRRNSPDRSDARVRDLVGLLKIGHLLDRRVAGLSGGEQQRIALARALAPQPLVLLLDEPLSALDPQNRRAVRRELAALHTALGTTTVHVTHDFEEALVLADRIAVINEGRVVQVGPPEEVFRRPASPFVAQFVGAENLFHGEVSLGQAGAPAGPESGGAVFRSRGLELSVIAEQEGPAYASIRPEEITVSREPPHSSAVNNLTGTIRNIEKTAAVVRLTVDAGVPFVVAITAQSFDSLQLGAGIPVYISFKATAIHIF
jgi:molybdopterin-binding protein